jgi:hypothetical protein
LLPASLPGGVVHHIIQPRIRVDNLLYRPIVLGNITACAVTAAPVIFQAAVTPYPFKACKALAYGGCCCKVKVIAIWRTSCGGWVYIDRLPALRTVTGDLLLLQYLAFNHFVYTGKLRVGSSNFGQHLQSILARYDLQLVCQ